jgi:2-methylisocitrate lyase-like PEP mutase family enzyme
VESATRLRELLKRPEILIAPGAYDGLTARLVELEGFPVVYASGAGISNTQYALADMGLVSMGEIVEQIRKITGAITTPVIADADTGYGNALNVYRTVREFKRAGVAAIQLEDQVSPKKCGHFNGKEVITKDEAVMKIKAAVDARGESDLVIIARTDAIAVHGLADAIDRARAYVEAGADGIFVEAPRSREELAEIGRSVPGFKVANIVEGGKTPEVSAEDLQAMGYQIVIYANAGMRSAIRSIRDTLKYLKTNGHTIGVIDRLATFEERNFVTRKPELDEIERRYARGEA